MITYGLIVNGGDVWYNTSWVSLSFDVFIVVWPENYSIAEIAVCIVNLFFIFKEIWFAYHYVIEGYRLSHYDIIAYYLCVKNYLVISDYVYG